MNARSVRPSPYRRYRRRILGWGAAGVAGVFAIGGPIFVNRVEDDLENRAVEVLDEAGVGPVAVHFSGQDGELRCLAGGPVDIPSDVIETIENLWGVASVDVAASCTDDPAEESSNGEQGDNDTTGTDVTVVATDVTDVTEPPDDDPPATTDLTSTAPDLDPLVDVVASDTQFSTLAGLLGDADLIGALTGDGPFTLFGPTNAAFEALGPNVTGALARDPDVLAAVLSHHVANGTVVSTDLVSGDLEMLDGTTIALDVGNEVVITSGDSTATVTETDLIASNGVVHAIDRVLLPADLVITVDPGLDAVGAGWVDGQLSVTGTVATEEQRAALIAAPLTAIDGSNVLDELTVDAAAPVTDATAGAFATVIEAMAAHLVGGRADVVDAEIAVTGTFASDADRDAFEAALAVLDADAIAIEVAPRPVADAEAASALEADLNQLVTDNPILFDPSSTTISGASAATVDRVAAIARRLGGITIVVEGHTDTDGLAASNQALSEGRARSVRDALVARGVPDEVLSIVGFGGSEPILDGDGVEDKAASRRVEFVVTATE